MGFWYFMLFMVQLTPAVMLIMGVVFIKRPPWKIQPIYGYRTQRSMINEDTWNFAHRHCGRIWIWCGSVVLVLSVAAMVLVRGNDEVVVGGVGGLLSMMQIVLLVCSIIPTERALKKTFDHKGNRKNSPQKRAADPK